MKKIHSAKKVAILFFFQLVVGLGLVFLIHLFFLDYQEFPLLNNNIIASYTTNLLLAVVIFLSLFFLRKKYNEQLGFLFLFSSFLKFIVFYVFFYPMYKADGDISKLEFFAFFIPYAICLIIETISLIKLLNLPEKQV